MCYASLGENIEEHGSIKSHADTLRRKVGNPSVDHSLLTIENERRKRLTISGLNICVCKVLKWHWIAEMFQKECPRVFIRKEVPKRSET